MFPERLKFLRSLKRITQADLAKALGVSISTVGNWETETREPNFETLVRIADYFKVSADYLLGRIDDQNVRLEVYKDDTEFGQVEILKERIFTERDVEILKHLIDEERNKKKSG